MQAMRSSARFLYYLLVIVVFGTAITHGNQFMARRTRPKGNSGPLKFFNDVPSFPRGRFGKRDDVVPVSELGTTWEILRMILNAQNEQRRQEKIRQNKKILLRDFQTLLDTDKHISRVAFRLGSLPDIIDKYYDDVQ